MPSHHAVILIDPHSAKIVRFDADQVHEQKVKEQLHLHTAQARSDQARHIFFGKVCDAVDGIELVLVVGGQLSLADFLRYVDQQRPQTALRLISYQMVNHPSDPELLALARAWFQQQGQPVGLGV